MERFTGAKPSAGADGLTLSSAPCQIPHPPPLDSNRVGRRTEGRPTSPKPCTQKVTKNTNAVSFFAIQPVRLMTGATY